MPRLETQRPRINFALTERQGNLGDREPDLTGTDLEKLGHRHPFLQFSNQFRTMLIWGRVPLRLPKSSWQGLAALRCIIILESEAGLHCCYLR